MPEWVGAVLVIVLVFAPTIVGLLRRESRAEVPAWRPSRTLIVLSWILGLIVAWIALPSVFFLYALVGPFIASIPAVIGIAAIVIPARMTWRELRRAEGGVVSSSGAQK